MALTKIGSIGINTGIQFAGVTTVSTLNASNNVLSVGGTVNFTGNVSIAGTLTYEDVTNVDSVGLITARDGVVVGSGITLSKDGDIFATGIVTATSFVGSGSGLTGVASTDNIRTNTDATFLQNVNVGSGITLSKDGDVFFTGIATGNGSGFTNLPAAQITGTLPAIDGSALTGVGITVAEGGNESTYESGGKNYMIHTFLTTGVFRTSKAMTIDFLLVGGGGGSAAAELNYGGSGGGGGGGLVEGSGFSLTAGTYIVTVGAGGAASNATTVGGTGGDTTFAGVTAKGGGGGADYNSVGGNGGSGGGGSEPNKGPGAEIQSSQNSGISNIQQFGFDGGQGGEYTSDPTGGGGGGGAGGNGARPTSTDHGNAVGGAAGAGRANSISGSSTLYGRGGIGGGSGYLNAEPGLNGRGDGATGATSTVGSEGAGAVGGTGIVIIKYEI